MPSLNWTWWIFQFPRNMSNVAIPILFETNKNLHHFQQIKHINFSVTLLLIGVLVGIATLFLYCYFGALVIECYDEMPKCLFESNWQGLSVDLQKYFILMIGNANRPLHYHGFGFTTLDLKTFSSLIKAVVTYYMAFKTVASEWIPTLSNKIIRLEIHLRQIERRNSQSHFYFQKIKPFWTKIATTSKTQLKIRLSVFFFFFWNFNQQKYFLTCRDVLGCFQP